LKKLTQRAHSTVTHLDTNLMAKQQQQHNKRINLFPQLSVCYHFCLLSSWLRGCMRTVYETTNNRWKSNKMSIICNLVTSNCEENFDSNMKREPLKKHKKKICIPFGFFSLIFYLIIIIFYFATVVQHCDLLHWSEDINLLKDNSITYKRGFV